jgi:uncharacterized membrane protein YfcA
MLRKTMTIGDFSPFSGGLSPLLLLCIAAAFAAGGIVKGTLGVGLPLFTVPMLSLVIPSPQAISLVAIPILVSNFWQAFDSGIALRSLGRFTPLMGALLVTTVLTVPMTLAMSPAALNVMVAGTVFASILLMALRPQFDIPARQEKIYGLVVGGFSGVMGGVSSLTGPLIISYLTALKLTREQFVGSISVIYLCGAIPLYISMAAFDRLGTTELALSIAGLIPLAGGLMIGKWLRGRLSELWFRRAILAFLSFVALALLVKALAAGDAPKSAASGWETGIAAAFG